jgi:Protein of unknown function (DUF3553)
MSIRNHAFGYPPADDTLKNLGRRSRQSPGRPGPRLGRRRKNAAAALQYFGQTALELCGRCDNCDAGRSSVTDRSEQALPAGRRVDRTDWGTGTVLASDAERITVLFDQNGYKELAASVAIGQGRLSPLS